MAVPVGKYTFIIYKTAVAIGLFHLPGEGVPFERTPAAATDDLVGSECPGLAAHEGEVCFHSFTNEAAPGDVEQAGWVVAHELHHSCDRQHALFDESQHSGQ